MMSQPEITKMKRILFVAFIVLVQPLIGGRREAGLQRFLAETKENPTRNNTRSQK
jgi:hypothetical protein